MYNCNKNKCEVTTYPRFEEMYITELPQLTIRRKLLSLFLFLAYVLCQMLLNSKKRAIHVDEKLFDKSPLIV